MSWATDRQSTTCSARWRSTNTIRTRWTCSTDSISKRMVARARRGVANSAGGDGPRRINDVRFRLGYLHEVMFEDRFEAFDLYRQIVMEEPQHGGALEGLSRMVEERP